MQETRELPGLPQVQPALELRVAVEAVSPTAAAGISCKNEKHFFESVSFIHAIWSHLFWEMACDKPRTTTTHERKCTGHVFGQIFNVGEKNWEPKICMISN